MDFVSNDNNSIVEFFDAADRFVNYGASRRGHATGVAEVARFVGGENLPDSVARRGIATSRCRGAAGRKPRREPGTRQRPRAVIVGGGFAFRDTP